MKHTFATAITALLLIFCHLLLKGSAYFLPCAFFVLGVYVGLIIYGSAQIKANYFVTSINCGNEAGIAITFDDGPHPDLTPKILDILDNESIKACFFVIGSKAEKHPDLLLEMHKRGHTIGNHSHSHSNMIAFFSSNKLKRDIEECSQTIENVTGAKPAFFRPPFGVTNPRYAGVLKRLGLLSVGWTVRSMDTVADNSELLLNRIIKDLTNGSIILLHDTQQITVGMLPKLISYCRTNGIKIVSLPQLINQKPLL